MEKCGCVCVGVGVCVWVCVCTCRVYVCVFERESVYVCELESGHCYCDFMKESYSSWVRGRGDRG